MEFSCRNVHLIGIGGIGMSALGIMASNAGMKVSGSDNFSNDNTDMLRDHYKIMVNIPQKREVINADIDLVVISSAIKDDNEELEEARRKNLKIIRRAQFLNLLTSDRKQIAVSGTHGKTTTSSLLGETLWYGGCDPLIFTGGIDKLFNSNVHDGKGEYFVFEADESDASFHHFDPYAAIVTNIEEDHVDFYGSMNDIEESFKRFVNKTRRLLVINYDDANCRKFIDSCDCQETRTYSLNDSRADYMISDVAVTSDGLYFSVLRKDDIKIEDFYLPHKGIHNLSNALAVIAVILELKLMTVELLRESLGKFKGVKRRFDVIGKFRNCDVIDDYAHHPSEIESVLKACKTHFSEECCSSNLVVIFQPHRYSRLLKFHKEFAEVLMRYPSKRVILSPAYSAGEKSRPGVDSVLIYEAMDPGSKEVLLTESLDEIHESIVKNTVESDILLFLGAGDINTVAYRLVEGS